MPRPGPAVASPRIRRLLATAVVLAALLGGTAELRPAERGNAAAGPASELTYIDTHAHLNPGPSCDFADSSESALSVMDSVGIRRALIMPTPEDQSADACHDFALAEIAASHPDRFAFVGGGATLFPMIVSGAQASDVRETALDILSAGAVGFGEVAAEHFSFRSSQPYLSMPPDDRLFLLLADIAAAYGVPIDFHMEAVPTDMPFPSALKDLSPNNPDTLHENITAFERLLAHNRSARVVWAHAGWDNTGGRTVDLMRRLLRDHPNLYMNVKLRRPPAGTFVRPNSPLDEAGRLDPEWSRLLREFPTRFFIGTDLKHPDDTLEPLSLTRALLDQLPPGIASLVGYKNATRVYNLDGKLICHEPGTRLAKTMLVATGALSGHLAHGDSLGPCRDGGP